MRHFIKAGTPDCFACRFRASCFFNRLKPESREYWNGARLSAAFSGDQSVYSEGEKPRGIFAVCRGRVKIFTTDSRGQQMINWIRHPGEIFGHIAFFSGKNYLCGAHTMGQTVLSFINAETLEKFMAAAPETGPLLLGIITNELMAAQLKLKDTAYKPARARVAMTLLRAISYKSKDTAAPAIYGLKRCEIAKISGLALETVVRTLAELEKRKLIKREVKAIRILDHAALARIAGLPPAA